MFLFFDTETTGLPLDWKAPVSRLNNWPRLVQLAWVCFDEKGEVEKKNFIIKPDGFKIPLEAINIHKITNEIAINSGFDIKTVLKQFRTRLKKAKYIVAHNLEFDEKVMGAEFLRQGINNELSLKKRICTMKAGTDFCAIPSRNGYKWPTLSELYFKLFNEQFKEKHNAEFDIDATVNCFLKLYKLGVINIPDQIINIKSSNMDIKEQAIFLKGFLESMTFNETISEGQINMLKIKLSELINTITGEDDFEEEDIVSPSKINLNRNGNTSSNISEPVDDLPF